MSYVVLFDAPYYSGTPITAESPHPWHVALGGHGYMVLTDYSANYASDARLQQNSVPLLRDQQDASDEVGEQSLSPNALWRRSNESWHLGAGQRRYDVKTSNEYRFLASLGVDVWTEGQLTLLNGLQPENWTGPAGVVSIVAGDLWYLGEQLGGSPTLRFVSDPVAGSTTGVTSTTGNIVSLATDGLNVWAAAGSSGLWATTTAITTASAYFTGSPNITLVGYAKGRLLVADNAGNLYNPVASGAALPAALLATGTGAGWTWTAISDGPNAIYACGYKGHQGAIYAVTIKSDGTALNAPFVAAPPLPIGETPLSLYTYSGFMLIGTTKGVRVAQTDASGYLTVGGLIPVGPVYGFDGQDRFVWFTWSNIQGGVGGLGRLDLSQFTQALIPAYATDLAFVSTLGTDSVTCRSVGNWLGRTVFTYEIGSTSYLGVEQPGSPVPAGWLDTGAISYGLVDLKRAMFVDVRHTPLVNATVSTNKTASVRAALSVDSGPYVDLGAVNVAGATGQGLELSANFASGETFDLRITLTAAGVAVPATNLPQDGYNPPAYVTTALNGSPGSAPVLHRLTLRSLGQPTRITQFDVPLLLHPDVRPEAGAPRYVDLAAEYAYLSNLFESQEPVILQMGKNIRNVIVYDMEWRPEAYVPKQNAWQGTFTVKLRDVIA